MVGLEAARASLGLAELSQQPLGGIQAFGRSLDPPLKDLSEIQ
jgi:hypothetical protein